jgi:hypothetical protein
MPPELGYPLLMQVPLPTGLVVSLVGDDWLTRDALAALDPFPGRSADGPPADDLPMTASDGDAFVVRGARLGLQNRFRELQLLAGDGHITGHDGERLWLLDGDAACSVPAVAAGTGATTIVVERGFPVARAFRSVIRPALQLVMAERGGVAIHAACVEVDGRAVLIAGWSESGKTETALALVEAGASFISDKWTVVTPDRTAAAFPIGVGVRGWVLRFLPRLRDGLPMAARVQLRVAAAGTFLTSPLRSRRGDGRLGRLASDAIRRSVALADRAALTPTQIRCVYGDTRDPARQLPIALVAVLQTRPEPGIDVTQGELDRVGLRLALSAATERGEYLALQRRAAYAEARPFDAESLVEADHRAIRTLLDGVPLIEVAAPFPTDPRRVADAISACL